MISVRALLSRFSFLLLVFRVLCVIFDIIYGNNFAFLCCVKSVCGKMSFYWFFWHSILFMKEFSLFWMAMWKRLLWCLLLRDYAQRCLWESNLFYAVVPSSLPWILSGFSKTKQYINTKSLTPFKHYIIFERQISNPRNFEASDALFQISWPLNKPILSI